TNGILFNKVRDTVVYEPAIAVALRVSGKKGFINSNTFQFLRVWGARVAIDFSVVSEYKRGVEDFGILYNHFLDLHFQSDGSYVAGVRDVSGVHNTFNEVKVWDIPGGKPALTIGPLADRTLVIGGTLAGEFAVNPGVIVDQGGSTKIV